MSETPSIDRLGEFVNFSVDAIVLVSGAGVIQWSNAATEEVLGYRAEDLIGIEIRDLVEPVDRDAWRVLVDRLLDDPATPVRGTFRCRHSGGAVRWTEAVARNLLQEPRVGGIVVYCRDVSDRMATADQIASTEDRYGRLFMAATDVMFEADPEGYFRFVNPQTLRLFEFAADEVIGRRFTEFVRADYRPQVLQHYYRQTAERRVNSYIEFPAITKSGKELWLGQSAWIISDAAENVIGMQAVARDITDRRHAEEGLRAAETKYRSLVEQSLMGVYILQNDRLVYVNPKAAVLLGYTQQEMVDSPHPFEFVHEQDRAMLMDRLSRLEPTRMPSVQLTMRGVRKDGQVIQVEAFCSVTEFGSERAILTTLNDISDRLKLEEQLRQAQKMEAVGRLAGGIAHDFNNLLTAIRGNAELMSQRVAEDPAMAAEVNEILHAADRAASLTRQLLAFSRKQVLQPVTLDLNDSINSVSKMARRLFDADIQLQLDLGSGVSRVLADPAQIEQVLLNLLVNARDALPAGGTITVQTSNTWLDTDAPELRQGNIAPGAFVLMNVTDNGCGMDPATQMRIFEPFFTTKETGRGTGLGLSTVYGIMRQTGGAITVTSKPGQGSSFKVYLPAVTGDLT